MNTAVFSPTSTSVHTNIRALAQLLLPVMITLCAASAVGFIDRVFLARHSLEALEGYVSGFVLAILFQTPLMRLTALTQAFVGYHLGANENSRIGPAVWQMIWV